MINNSIYLDACATSPPHEEVLQLINSIQSKYWANPSSLYEIGVQASEVIERSRLNISQLLNAHYEDIIFTSGATESNNIALIGSAINMKPGRIVISSVEHPSVIGVTQTLKKLGWDVNYWPVDSSGLIDLDLIDKYLNKPTKILSVIWAQSEIGTIQPIEFLGEECRKRGIVLHTDATQYLSNKIISWNTLNIHYLSASAHKFRGPKGVGLLLKNSRLKTNLYPLFAGGSQESGYRSGTSSVALIAGMGLALKMLYKDLSDYNNRNSDTSKTLVLTKQLTSILSNIEYTKFTGSQVSRLSNHISILVGKNETSPISGKKLAALLNQKGIYVSSGTACTSNSKEPSHVLKAIGIHRDWRESSLRFSLGPWLESSELEYVVNTLKGLITNF